MTASASTAVAMTAPVSVRAAAAGAVTICVAFAGMQVALAAGAPLGEHVWGGTQDRVLSAGMRAVSVGAAAALTATAVVIGRRGGLAGRPAPRPGGVAWGIAGYFALNTLGNAASTSPVERFAFAPATAVVAGLTAFVALRSGSR